MPGYNVGLVNNIIRWLSKPIRTVVVGCLAGLLLSIVAPSQGRAQAVLFFPEGATRALFASTTTAGKDAPPEIPDARMWAESRLLNKRAVDWVCKVLERADVPHRRAAIQAAILVLDAERLQVVRAGESSLLIQIEDERPEVALLLCELFVRYLGKAEEHEFGVFKKFHSDVADRQVAKLGPQLRKTETLLASRLWQSHWLGPRGSATDQATPLLEQSDYQAQLGAFRGNMRDRFFGKLTAEYQAPGFTVVAPAALERSTGIPRLQAVLGGALIGLSLSLLARLLIEGQP